MDRKQFIKTLGLLPLTLTTAAMKWNNLEKLTSGLIPTAKMPTLFVGHGSPMNAIETNEFSLQWQAIGKTLPRPKAILCISAHWETPGTYITAMRAPKTIHDFGGFPQALFDVQYPAPGSPELAEETKQAITKTELGLDEKWGLDHGCWSVLKHLYPKADVPVIQLSLDYRQPPRYHYELAKELQVLRKKGVLIIGSGNMVHNLGAIDWKKIHEPEFGYDWALEANTKMKALIANRDHTALIQYSSQGKAFEMAIPSPDHFLPLLYVLALQEEDEQVSIFNDKAVMGSITMTSLTIG